MCAMLRNFDFLERIIGLNLENNRKNFQEVRNRIIGKILSVIASSLPTGTIPSLHTEKQAFQCATLLSWEQGLGKKL